MRGEPNPLEFQRSIARELNSVKDRVRNLIGGAHWGEEGRYKEIVLRNVIGRFLPSNLSVGTGFVIEAEGRHGWRTSRPTEFMISRQIDVIIYDNTIPSLFSQGDFARELVVEGTNFGVGKVPLPADEGSKLMERIVGSSQLTIATSHYLDVKFLRAVVKAAQGSSVLIASKVMSQFLRRDMFAELEEPLVAEEYVKGVPDLDTASIYDYELSSEKLVIITSYYELIDLVRNLREWSVSLSDMTVMLSESEPKQEESVEYEALLRWMDILGILTYRVRVSGHYYPFELTKLISTVKPKQVIPIHTQHPRLVLTLARI